MLKKKFNQKNKTWKRSSIMNDSMFSQGKSVYPPLHKDASSRLRVAWRISPLSAPQRTGSQWSLSGSGGGRHDEFQFLSSAKAERAPPVEKQSQLNTHSFRTLPGHIITVCLGLLILTCMECKKSELIASTRWEWMVIHSCVSENVWKRAAWTFYYISPFVFYTRMTIWIFWGELSPKQCIFIHYYIQSLK